jgi:hypothetical protein
MTVLAIRSEMGAACPLTLAARHANNRRERTAFDVNLKTVNPRKLFTQAFTDAPADALRADKERRRTVVTLTNLAGMVLRNSGS